MNSTLPVENSMKTAQTPATAAAPLADVNVLCRICLNGGNRMVSIFHPIPDYDQKTLHAMLMLICTPLNGKDAPSGLSEKICRNCKWKLLTAYDLYETCLENDERLRHMAVVGHQSRRLLGKRAICKVHLNDGDAAENGLVKVKQERTEDNREAIEEETTEKNAYGDHPHTDNCPEPEDAPCANGSATDNSQQLLVEAKANETDPFEKLVEANYSISESGEHTCKICGQCFQYKSQCRSHIVAKHNPSKPYKCDVCHCTLTSELRLIRHKALAHGAGRVCEDEAVDEAPDTGDRTYTCPICSKVFQSVVRFRRHKGVHVVYNRPYKCEICLYRFPTKPQLTQHMKVHEVKQEQPDTPGEYKCDLCDEVFSGKRALTMHSRKSHVQETREGGKERDYTCIICTKSFVRESVLNTHMKMHELMAAEKEKDQRQDLEKLIKQEVQAQQQKISKAGGGNREGSSDVLPSPEVLNETSVLATVGLTSVNSVNTGEGPKKKSVSDIVYVCMVCEKEFEERDHLKKHQKEQHAELKLDIVSGDNGPPVSDELGDSQRTTDDGDEDDVSMTDPSGHEDDNLMVPLETMQPLVENNPQVGDSEQPKRTAANGNYPLKCHLCHKTFLYNCYLTMHMKKNHDESKPYGCQTCHYRFGYRGTLLRHKLLHSEQSVRPGGHGSIIFKCRICSAKFLELKSLNTHLKRHRFETDSETAQKVQIFHCTQCSQIFSEKEQYEEHMLKQHKQQVHLRTSGGGVTAVSSPVKLQPPALVPAPVLGPTPQIVAVHHLRKGSSLTPRRGDRPRNAKETFFGNLSIVKLEANDEQPPIIDLDDY